MRDGQRGCRRDGAADCFSGEIQAPSAPKSQIAIATIFLCRGQIARTFPRKSAIFEWNSKNEIAIASDGNSQL